MCLHVLTSKPSVKFSERIQPYINIAKEDITVYKRFSISYPYADKRRRPVLKSPYRSTVWDTQSKTVRGFRGKVIYSSIEVHQGLHAYTKKDTHRANNNYAWTIPMIIPKGTKYIIGTNDEIVSLKLEFKKPLAEVLRHIRATRT